VVALDPLTDLAIIKIDNTKNETFKVLNFIEDEKYIKI
jgi:S1-C subfamily serine protease